MGTGMESWVGGPWERRDQGRRWSMALGGGCRPVGQEERSTPARDVVGGGHQGNREGPLRYGPGVVSQSSGLKGCQERPEKPFQ